MRYESFSNNHLSLFAMFVTRSVGQRRESKVQAAVAAAYAGRSPLV